MRNALLVAAAATVTAPVCGHEVFKDWAVGCDNGRACQAAALQPEGGGGASAEMVVTRGAAAQATLQIEFGADFAMAVAGDKSFRLRAGDVVSAVSAGDVSAMVGALRSASRLSLRDANGEESGAVSLAGFSAALRYMDDRQRRVGTVTAFVATGPKPAWAVPPPPVLPVVRMPQSSAGPLPKLDARKLMQASGSNECGASEHNPAIDAHRLDAHNALVLVPDSCNGGAYNFASRVLIANNRGNTRTARFDDKTIDIDGILYNASYDPATRQLDSYMKGRGLGDCGSSQSFAWDGKMFRLVFAAEMRECRGVLARIPSWRANATAD